MKIMRITLFVSIILITLLSCNNDKKKSLKDRVEDKVEEKAADVVNEAFGGDMFKAAREGDLETIKEGVKAGEDVNQTNSYSETLLLKASERGHFEIVKYLLENGADKSKEDIYHNTAAKIGKTDEIREYIRNYGEEESK